MHLGSLSTALASFLDARANKGQWLLRIDDLDTPRNRAGSVELILACLETFGLHWDGEVYYQSTHIADYEGYLSELDYSRLTYRCTCSRKSLAEFTPAAVEASAIYPGICRDRSVSSRVPHAVRIKTQDGQIAFTDEIQGQVVSHIAQQHGDFILKRKDGIIAYQFAVVIDDYLQKINQIVRGCDLLSETPKQIYLQQLLKFPAPRYKHVPLIVNSHGFKLSKQTLATAVNIKNPGQTLFKLLKLLKQNPPDELSNANVGELLNWGISQWQVNSLSHLSKIEQHY